MSNVERGESFKYEEGESSEKEYVRLPIDAHHHLVIKRRVTEYTPFTEKGPVENLVGTKVKDSVFIEDVGTGKKIVDFGELLGLSEEKRVSFHHSSEGEFAAHPQLRSVSFDYERLKDPREIFAILHELGHIGVSDSNGKEYLEDVIMNRAPIMITKQPPNIEFIIQDERASWAEAIKLARKIKREFGVNLFGLFHNIDEFMGWFRATGLRTYESELEESGIKAYSKEKKVKLWQEAEKQREGLLTEEVKAEDFSDDESSEK